MPIVRFLGFPDGDTVSLSASQGGASDSVTLTNWNTPEGGAGDASVSIEVVRAPSAAQYAPEAVWFYANASGFDLPPAPANSVAYDPAFHEVEYEWSFGDPGDTFTTPVNMIPEHRDANSAIGRQAAHVFRAPGTYTVTCTARRVVDPDTFTVVEAVRSVTVEVGDPDTIFDATNTVVVAYDDDFTGAPPSDHQLGSAAIDGGSAWYNYTQGSSIAKNQPLRVLFKRGGDYSNGDIGMCHRIAFGNYTFVHYGAWGSGTKPIGSRTRAFMEGVPAVWQDIIFEASYDGITEDASGGGSLFRTDKHAYHLLTGCELRKDRIGFNHDNIGSVGAAMNVLHECAIYELQQYGLFHFAKPENWDGNGFKNRLAILGCLEYDLGAAPHGQGSPNGQKQGPMRGFEGEDVVIQSCEFFSRTGWTGQGTWPVDGAPMTAIQPVLRFAAGRPSSGTQRNGDVVVSRCTSEGGNLIDKNVSDNAIPSVRNTLIEQCIMTLAPTVINFGKIQNGATTWRNNLHIFPDVSGSRSLQKLLEVSSADKPGATFDQTQRLAEPVLIYNNSFIVLDDSSVQTEPFDQLDEYTTYIDENNVVYIAGNPGYVRHEDIAPFDTAELWPARYLGRNEWVGGAPEGLQTQYATPAGTISLYQPLATSPVVGTTMGRLAYSDLLGRARLTTQSRGALEP
ncbi:MAG: hypothetical protein AAGB05_09965 [Pseudomonadota bacterium]